MKILISFLILCFLVACASLGLPPGGDVDKSPPKIISSTPDSAAVNFQGDQITLTFDEYFTASNLANTIIISPPFNTPITTKIKGKTLIISFPETLKENTTYQFYLGSSIKDQNEGNKTQNLKVLFSTGTYIDTSYIHGTIMDAFTKKPVAECKVVLYKIYSDSSLLKVPPYYITITDEQGHFSFENIGNQSYYMYALKDENNNNFLDLKEDFAFLLDSVKANTQNHQLLLSLHEPDKNIKLLNIRKQVKTNSK